MFCSSFPHTLEVLHVYGKMTTPNHALKTKTQINVRKRTGKNTETIISVPSKNI